jgi:hypothetical protein
VDTRSVRLGGGVWLTAADVPHRTRHPEPVTEVADRAVRRAETFVR